MMVALKFFIDEDKSVDWVVALEKRLRLWGSIRGFEIAFVLLVVVALGVLARPRDRLRPQAADQHTSDGARSDE